MSLSTRCNTMSLTVKVVLLAGGSSATVLTKCADWTSVPIQPIFLKMLGRITNRVFIGLPICRNEKWLDTAFEHAHNGERASPRLSR